MPVKDGPSCPGCGLSNYEGMCPVCRGDEQATRDEGLPYPWPVDDTDMSYGDVAAAGENDQSRG